MFLQEHPTDIIMLSVQLHGNPNVFKFTSDHNAVTSSCFKRSSTTPTNKCKSGTSDTKGSSSASKFVGVTRLCLQIITNPLHVVWMVFDSYGWLQMLSGTVEHEKSMDSTCHCFQHVFKTSASSFCMIQCSRRTYFCHQSCWLEYHIFR
jgi:hypothetical protein